MPTGEVCDSRVASGLLPGFVLTSFHILFHLHSPVPWHVEGSADLGPSRPDLLQGTDVNLFIHQESSSNLCWLGSASCLTYGHTIYTEETEAMFPKGVEDRVVFW